MHHSISLATVDTLRMEDTKTPQSATTSAPCNANMQVNSGRQWGGFDIDATVYGRASDVRRFCAVR